MRTPRTFVDALASLDLPDTFNPYRDTCPLHDAPSAARVRRDNLERCLEAAIKARANTIWVARDLGYRGGRRTGIPLTDEVHLADASHLFRGATFARATRGPVVAERTASITWDLLRRIERPVMLWNVFPLHPHGREDPMSNRCHNRLEREATRCFILALLDMLAPARLVTIGRDAAAALSDLDVPISAVRHPSYGGRSEFSAGIQSIYGLHPAEASAAGQLSFDSL